MTVWPAPPGVVGCGAVIVPQTVAMLPFLLLSTRAEDELAVQEHQAVARHMGIDPQRLEQWRLEQAPMPAFDPDRYAGLLIGGSPFTGSDPQESKGPVQRRVEAEMALLLDRVVVDDYPVLGLCYGIGILGRHQGAVVDTTHGESLGAPTIRLTQAAASDPVCAGLPPEFLAFVGHKEAILRPTPAMTVLASSDGCPVQMLRVGQHVRATQFHPELDAEALVTRIRAYAHHGYFQPEEQDSLIEQARATDVHACHQVLANFAELYG